MTAVAHPPASAGLVDTEDRAGVRVIALRRTPVNAINLAMVAALGQAFAAALAADECAAVVFTGLPRVFSAGIDTREVPSYDPPTRAVMLRGVNRTVLALYGCPKPVVAAISGHALGAGLVLALACDLRLAARGPYKLGLTEAAAGIPFPAGPLEVVKAELSPERARRLALIAESVPPDSPLLHGVVDRVVDPERLLDEAEQEARRLAALPAYARVKAQLRAATLARLRQIADHDDEPLLRGWV